MTPFANADLDRPRLVNINAPGRALANSNDVAGIARHDGADFAPKAKSGACGLAR